MGFCLVWRYFQTFLWKEKHRFDKFLLENVGISECKNLNWLSREFDFLLSAPCFFGCLNWACFCCIEKLTLQCITEAKGNPLGQFLRFQASRSILLRNPLRSYPWSCLFSQEEGWDKFDILRSRRFHPIFTGKSSPQSWFQGQKHQLSQSQFLGFNCFVKGQSSFEVISRLLQDCFNTRLESKASKVTFSQQSPIWHCMRLSHIQFRYAHLKWPFLRFPWLSKATNYNLGGRFVPRVWN